MSSVGVMASAVYIAAPTCVDVLMEPFDNIAAWTAAGTPATSIVAARTANGVSFPTFSSATLTYTIPTVNQSDTVTVGFAFKAASWSGGETNILELRSDSGATYHNYLSIANDRSIRCGTATSGQGGTASGVFTFGAWSYLEVQAKLADSGGFITVKLNGTTILNPTGIDTKNAGTKTVYDSVRVLCQSTGAQVVFDDLYISAGATCAFKGDQTIGPPITGNVVWWLDAADDATFSYSSGTVVSQWRDKSTNVKHAAQGTVGNQPTRVSGAQNGRPVVRFGSGQQLATAAPMSTLTDNFAIFVACNRTGGNATQSVVVHNGDPNSNGHGLALRANTANLGLAFNGDWRNSSTPDPAAPAVLDLTRGFTSWDVYLNGTATSIATTVTPNTPTGSTVVPSGVHPWQGDVYEILAYDRNLTISERRQVEFYLMNKWLGLPVVAASSSQVGTAAGASPPATTTIPSPAGVAVGDLLLAFITLDSTSFVADKSTGWTSIVSAGIPMYVAGRIADGSANDTLKIGGTNFAPNEDYAVVIVRITGHSVTNVTTIPATSNTGTNTAPDTGGIGAGAFGRLFVTAAYCDRNALETFTGRPAVYTDVATLVSSANSGSSVTLSVAQRANIGTAGDDPTAFSLSSSAPWGCVTLAVPR